MISQPTFFPWIGYFDMIDQVNIFVVLDDANFSKQSWHQRNKFKSKKGMELFTVPVKNVNISSNFIDLEFPKIANSIEVNLLENKDNFTDDEWKNLYKLSEDTFVEESDSLKEGAAGAGLTDND